MITSIAFTMISRERHRPRTKVLRAGSRADSLAVFQDAWIEYDRTGGTFAITTLAEGTTPSTNAEAASALK
jgi:hypothetical protein